ncbi:MAG TPA: GTP cyclohydrolase I FolE [Candidatus Gracilibacteria bacterium]|nr:GTP cyclohydrolase I FolE [Candidatus Gracilibacteria bacterium]
MFAMNEFDHEKNPQQLVKGLLEFIGEDPAREGLIDTPKRVVKAYEKLFCGYSQKPEDVLTVFGDELYDEMIVVKDIEFYSTCEHHMLPFFGKAHVGYIPDGKIIGLSKMPRLVEIYARRLQNQERMTSQIAQGLYDVLKPKGVGVIVEAKHFCMMARGVEKQNSLVATSSLRGLFKKELSTRNEFLRHIGR